MLHVTKLAKSQVKEAKMTFTVVIILQVMRLFLLVGHASKSPR